MCSAVSWFNFLANECVAVLEAFGLNLGISSSVLGITVLAWGNSVGDLVADTALVRQNRPRPVVALRQKTERITIDCILRNGQTCQRSSFTMLFIFVRWFCSSFRWILQLNVNILTFSGQVQNGRGGHFRFAAAERSLGAGHRLDVPLLAAWSSSVEAQQAAPWTMEVLVQLL